MLKLEEEGTERAFNETDKVVDNVTVLACCDMLVIVGMELSASCCQKW